MIRCYATDHQHSRVIMHAFAEGCGGQIVPPVALYEGQAAMYGILRGTGDIIRKCERVGRSYHYLDHGYIGAGHYDGYYRVALNGRQSVIPVEREWSSDRFKSLGVELKPWRKDGKHILIVPLTGAVADFYQIDAKNWLADTAQKISKHTDRNVLVKAKGEGNIQEALRDCWCVVTHSSNCAVDALLEGVPVVTLGESAAEPVSWNLEDIERPYWPERENWAFGLAWHQWRLDELRSGLYADFAGIDRRVAA